MIDDMEKLKLAIFSNIAKQETLLLNSNICSRDVVESAHRHQDTRYDRASVVPPHPFSSAPIMVLGDGAGRDGGADVSARRVECEFPHRNAIKDYRTPYRFGV